MPAKKSAKSTSPIRTTALCYIRQSYTRDKNDINSPERQRANIQALCDRNGWVAEWYVDAEGHKTGTKETNRPYWMALKARLPDPDVVAIVANDLARLHRKAWHVGRTMEELDGYGVRLVLAAPGREVDTSTPHGRMFINMIAMNDEAYAVDVGQRSVDSAAFRKNKGVTIGIPPFGTIRDEEGYLVPTPKGAWLLPDGAYAEGVNREEPPVEGAVWFGYFECAERILTLYAENTLGFNRIAKKLTKEGWRFKDRKGKPRLIDSDDIRRVTANWREYAGLVSDGKAKARTAGRIENPTSVLYDTGRAVFPLDLLKRVAEVQQARSFTIKRAAGGGKESVYDYALLQLVFCAHCDRIAAAENNPKRRTRLSGSNTDKPRYRHAQGVQCGSKTRSIPAEALEGDFFRLVNLLSLKEELLPSMLELAAKASPDEMTDEELEKQKNAAIAKHKRRIEAARNLYEDGDMNREEYLKRRDENERMIVHWETRSTEMQKRAIELSTCLNAFNRLVSLWGTASGEERLSLARGLFEYVVFDLDAKRIVDFRLHPWADQYLILRGEMYPDGENKNASSPSRNEATYDPSKIHIEQPLRHKRPSDFFRAISFSQRVHIQRLANHL